MPSRVFERAWGIWWRLMEYVVSWRVHFSWVFQFLEVCRGNWIWGLSQFVTTCHPRRTEARSKLSAAWLQLTAKGIERRDNFDRKTVGNVGWETTWWNRHRFPRKKQQKKQQNQWSFMQMIGIHFSGALAIGLSLNMLSTDSVQSGSILKWTVCADWQV